MEGIMRAITQLLNSDFISMKQNQTKPLYLLRKHPIQRRSKATVEAVLEAGARLLVTIGYDKASTNKIAETAGISIGSLYEYFPGIEAVFAEIRRREDQRYISLVRAEPVPNTVRETLRLNITTYITLVLSNIELHAALVRDVPQYATTEADSILVSDWLAQSNQVISSQAIKLRPQCESVIALELTTRVLRSTINDYALHAPERLKHSVVADQLVDMLERYMLP
jgi:AcrR family transcriptional regulator